MIHLHPKSPPTTRRFLGKRAAAALCGASLALAMAASPAAAAEITATAQAPIVELSVTETVDSAPDLASFGTGVTTRAPTAQAALRQNSAEMDRLIERIRSLGVAAEDIQTTGINLNAEFDYSGQERRFIGYQVTNQVQVKVRDLDRLGGLLDAVVGSGANNLHGPNFSIDDDSEAKRQARERALENARTQALDYAQKAGFSGVALLSVSEFIASGGPIDPPRPLALQADRAESVPVAPGQVGTSVSLHVAYQMTR